MFFTQFHLLLCFIGLKSWSWRHEQFPLSQDHHDQEDLQKDEHTESLFFFVNVAQKPLKSRKWKIWEDDRDKFHVTSNIYLQGYNNE